MLCFQTLLPTSGSSTSVSPSLVFLLIIGLIHICESHLKNRLVVFYLNGTGTLQQRKRRRNLRRYNLLCLKENEIFAESKEKYESEGNVKTGKITQGDDNLNIHKFEGENVKINSNMNINIFRSKNDTSSAYDEGMCIYSFLKDIEIKDLKKVPSFNPELADVQIEKKNDYIKLKKIRKNSYLENPLIYKDTKYELPYILNYFPDDMFIFNFDGVINMNKQEKIVVAFLTFLRIFQVNISKQKFANSENYINFLFNNKPIEGLPLYDFLKSRKYLLLDGERNKPHEHNEDPFILLKLIPKFLYARLLHIYKYLKNNEDLVISIKYIYDEIDAICTKYNYDINQMIRICKNKNIMQAKLQSISNSVTQMRNSREKNEQYGSGRNGKDDEGPKEELWKKTHGTAHLQEEGKEPDNETHLNIYELVKELTEGTFNPSIIMKYKRIENFPNIFPSFQNDFEDFYKKKMNLKLYERYRVNPKDIQSEFEKIRKLLMENENNAYVNLMKYRYAFKELNEQERKNHETFNFCAVDLINHNINVFKKPIYIISTVENTDFIDYTLKLYGVEFVRKEDQQLLRIFGKDFLQNRDNPTYEKKSNTIVSNLKRLFKSPYFSRTGREDDLSRTSQSEEEQQLLPDDYLHDEYNIDLNYLKYREKTKKNDYNFVTHSYYMNILKEKCDMINFIISQYHQKDDVQIHIIDQKYEDLNALNNDTRFNKKVRLYFCEWGYNSYADRLKAIHNDRIKSFSESFKLVFLCCTHQNSPRREHTHGRGIPLDIYSKFMLKFFLKKGIITKTSDVA
ncbi:hypothetical protein, conserved [Plasmodium gonderi]|uniref:Uncharacterized protein n=1 Tax=Plasmodium gonderi TaxID=77519 RepID=A0A1Y1JEQ4_PLAGO|nr:hypothetical protein, conserved [Plasmodium gonderi]GAW79697.1 hypothetical protein, conserved [Plasmodium gonderi]